MRFAKAPARAMLGVSRRLTNVEHPSGGDLSLDKQTKKAIGEALGRIPQGLFVLTAAYEAQQLGVMVSWVQQVSFEPPMVLIALRKGRGIVPLIHESHAFALNQLDKQDRVSRRKFIESKVTNEDRLEAMDIVHKATGAPVLAKALAFLDCELVRHMDIDGDHDLYIGLVREGGLLHSGDVEVRLREDGFTY
jgi:flavin reductase (DIM6/NTAB) family NADH-FMN oxidoreductase RutF